MKFSLLWVSVKLTIFELPFIDKLLFLFTSTATTAEDVCATTAPVVRIPISKRANKAFIVNFLKKEPNRYQFTGLVFIVLKMLWIPAKSIR
ncbi:hypothetical protein SDC9_77355 [bioreactor metagenome]|uniref:Uncharacterized protein n=1 Tax=bioreactor metagenome TaxID=1076179 RepID=A0A644YQC9_9ZZZZ